MAIQNDFTIDVVGRRITYTAAFVDDRPPSIYVVNDLYKYLQDTFDEPGFMQYTVPMSAQTPTQYTFINGWFIDDESIKALYGGSIQTSGWLKSGANGITQLRWTSGSSDAPTSGDIGVTLTGGGSGATGRLLAVDAVRQVAWVRNTSAAQFSNNENVTGTGVDLQTETTNGVQTGETTWSNLFSVGSIQTQTEIYIAQEPDYQGGTAYHQADADSRFRRRREKLDEWWDSDVDFTASPNLLGGAGHFDVLVKTSEAGTAVDGQRLSVFARQFSKVYSHFTLTGGVGNFVVPFASGASDLNAQDGPYNIGFDAGAGGKAQLDIGDILENDTGTNPVGRLRAVVTAVNGTTSGDFDFYLIGENEPLTTTNRTLKQLAENENMKVRGNAFTFDIDATGTALNVKGPGLAQGITITFAATAVDVDENASTEDYACTINCNNVALASVYKRVMFLTSRGNQDGTSTDTQDTLLPSGIIATDEAGEFYRGVGSVVFNYDGGVGTQPSQGDLVTNGTGSYGVVTSITAGTSGVCVLTQVKGVWADGDTVADIDAAGGNSVTVNEPTTGVARTIVHNTAAPFGTFAGGRWFVARGVVLTNVGVDDANNWETVDLAGTRRAPPTQRKLTFAGLEINDRAGLFEVGTSGGTDIVQNQNGVGAGGASIGAATIPLDSTVELDVPTTGWARVVDASSTSGEEWRLAYSAVAGTTITLDQGAWSTGATTGSESATVLTDTGAFTNFGSAGQIRTGMLIRNDTLSEWAIVLRKVSDDAIETTPLSGGGNWHSAGTADTWTANAPVVALVDADTVYFPFIDDTAIATSIQKTIKFVDPTFCIARARFSDPDIGGDRILPFEQKLITITDADLTITAIRTTDTIAT
jgi:hypothetical protein